MIRRNSSVLKKCGQYQDLITLTQGYSKPYTYVDYFLHGDNYRESNISLFNYSNVLDFDNLYNNKYKYTLVLDSDTIVPNNTILSLIDKAEQNNDYVIYQPRIELCKIETYFQFLQKLWLKHSNYIYSSTTLFLKHSSFFGKGLINNEKYITKCIGLPDNIIEYVPSNALSHDTFEATCLPVLYIDDNVLYEVPPKSYISWNIREIRWNIGELIVARHLYPYLMCAWRNPSYTRNKYKLKFIEKYFALSSIRTIVTWPFLLLFIYLNNYIPWKNTYTSYLYIIITSIIIPNVIIKLCFNVLLKELFLSIITLIFHTLSEPLIGSLRLIYSIYKVINNNYVWVPSNSIEKSNISNKNIIYSLSIFSIFSILSGILLSNLDKTNYLLISLLLSIIMLPFYSIISRIRLNRKLFISRLSFKRINYA
jgi:hypothetical protein